MSQALIIPEYSTGKEKWELFQVLINVCASVAHPIGK